MKQPLLTAALAFAALALAAPVLASPGDRPAAHESRCEHDARALKGEERDKALAECHARPVGSQQEKMKTCNVEARAKDLHGDERRAFMSTCLKG